MTKRNFFFGNSHMQDEKKGIETKSERERDIERKRTFVVLNPISSELFSLRISLR